LVLCQLPKDSIENPRSLRRFGTMGVRMKSRAKNPNAKTRRSQRTRGGFRFQVVLA
jgi:hypothetical protein